MSSLMNGESSGTKLKVYSSVLPSQLMINWACHVQQYMLSFKHGLLLLLFVRAGDWGREMDVRTAFYCSVWDKLHILSLCGSLLLFCIHYILHHLFMAFSMSPCGSLASLWGYVLFFLSFQESFGVFLFFFTLWLFYTFLGLLMPSLLRFKVVLTLL